MNSRSQHGLACLPVTALHAINQGVTTLLLSNEGSSLCIRAIEDGHKIFRQRIFESQIIHGITAHPLQDHHDTTTQLVIVWGGQFVSLLTVTTQVPHSHEDGLTVSVDIVKSLSIDDWIMTARFDKHGTVAILLTAHNSVWEIDLKRGSLYVPKMVVAGQPTLLYSGWIDVSVDNHIMVASGTIFGEVILWTYSKTSEVDSPSTQIQHIFIGHRGSVFGVAISDVFHFQGRTQRLLASCSDDRSLRIWNISDIEEHQGYYSKAPRGLQQTGFRNCHEHTSQLAVAWGHLSRIWDVNFINKPSAAPNNEFQLVTRGEDGVCQFWRLDLADLFSGTNKSQHALQPSVCDRYHTGKNIWSFAVDARLSQTLVVTGGADGQIIIRRDPGSARGVQYSTPFSDLVKAFSSQPSPRAMKQYLVFTDGSIVATTDSGQVVCGSVDGTRSWSVIHHSSEATKATLCSNHDDRLAFYSYSHTKIFAYHLADMKTVAIDVDLPSTISWMRVSNSSDHPVERGDVVLLANLHRQSNPIVLFISMRNNTASARIVSLNIPSDFMVTSFLYDVKRRLLICGSRAGALLVCNRFDYTTSSTSSALLIRHVHGSDSVTSITEVPDPSRSLHQGQMHILTTGRDGTFALHCLETETNSDESTKLETFHSATPPLGPSIEGAHFTSSADGRNSLITYGFKSTNFVVWDETNQIQLMTVQCGGSHRNWYYSPVKETSGLLVWTKAGTFNTFLSNSADHRTLQQGGHGREIKALAVSPILSPTSADGLPSANSHLLVTGSEDTEIILSYITPSSIVRIASLKRHTTGLQALRFSACACYLFSSGGIEEFFVWKLKKVPVFGLGAIIIGELSKSKEDEDARIMDFDVFRERPNTSAEMCFLILIAYSNGKAKLFEFTEGAINSLNNFRLIQQFNIGTLCLTLGRMIMMNSSSSHVLLGGTNGSLYVSELHSPKHDILLHRVHQNSIAAMSTYELNSSDVFIATGGDDGALGFTMLRIRNRQPVLETILVPEAHAAGVTALRVYWHEHGNSGLVVSAGNDQTVKTWKLLNTLDVCNGVQEPEVGYADVKYMQDIVVSNTGVFPVDVADISGLEIIRKHHQGSLDSTLEIIVAGVGLQSLVVDLAM